MACSHCLGKAARTCYTLFENSEGPFFVSTSPGESTNRAPQPPAEHLQGIIERVTYHAEDSGYTVARLNAPGERDLRTSRSAPHRRPTSKLIHCGPLR
jgi:hypothetical protein